ncbi:MAG: hypothetical protein RSD63_10290 [Eubacterium sp.]
MLNPYACMYDARMDVYRWRDIEVDGITKKVKALVVVGIPCRYSSSGQVGTGTPNPSITNNHKLFCGINEDVKEGDQLLVTFKNGKIIEVRLGECHPYIYQWQCEIKRDDNA